MLLLKLLLLLLVANGTPILAKRLLHDRLSFPLDAGHLFFDGEPIFGASKTIRGVVLAPLITMLAALTVGLPAVQGFVIGIFAILGDLISSFVKRRFKLASGSKATLLDQVPESLLPLFVYSLFWELGWLSQLFLCAAFSAIEIFISPLLYRWRLRSQPH